MKKLFTFFAAALAAMTLSAAELTLDLNAAQGYASEGSANVQVTSSVLWVDWHTTAAWAVSGAEFALDNLTGITEISFEYTGDGLENDMLVYLVDADENKLWDAEVGGQDLSETGWVSVTLHPQTPLWCNASQEPWVKLLFVANPATATQGVFYLRNIKITHDSPEPVIYHVAEAIAAADASTISENDEIMVMGIISKIEFKGTNFTRYGSANIYVADATGAEGEFEFYNCYSLLADTFRTSDPAYDATSSTWAQFNSVTDGNGVTVNVGDTVVAEGKYKKYNSTYELNTGCYLTAIMPFVAAPELPQAPEAAPAAPTRDEADVMAIYCNHYANNNYNFNVLGWGGVATWHADTIDGTNILACTDMKWEILTNWDADHYDVSAYENLHADVWVPADAKLKITFEALSGTKPSVEFDLVAGWNSIDKALSEWNYSFADMRYFIFEGYKTPAGESFEGNPFAFANLYFWGKAPEVERELTKLGINFPTENCPADNNIEMAGTFAEGTMLMEKIDTGWFLSYDFVNAAEDDTFKFRDKTNNDLVLCKFIPANGDAEGKWVQAIIKFGNYWSEDIWKGQPCMLIELDLSDAAQYAWKEGMPEPEPGDDSAVEYTTSDVKAQKVIRDGQILIIRGDKTFNALGAEVR